MNPIVWRFMGGVTVAKTADMLVPGYAMLFAAGIGAAIPEGGKKTGVRKLAQVGLQGIGKAEWKVLTSPKGPMKWVAKGLLRQPLRFIPVIGWGLVAYDVGSWMYRHPDYMKWMWEEFETSDIQTGGYTPFLPRILPG